MLPSLIFDFVGLFLLGLFSLLSTFNVAFVYRIVSCLKLVITFQCSLSIALLTNLSTVFIVLLLKLFIVLVAVYDNISSRQKYRNRTNRCAIVVDMKVVKYSSLFLAVA